jgi:hypothetical protein
VYPGLGYYYPGWVRVPGPRVQLPGLGTPRIWVYPGPGKTRMAGIQGCSIVPPEDLAARAPSPSPRGVQGRLRMVALFKQASPLPPPCLCMETACGPGGDCSPGTGIPIENQQCCHTVLSTTTFRIGGIDWHCEKGLLLYKDLAVQGTPMGLSSVCAAIHKCSFGRML